MPKTDKEHCKAGNIGDVVVYDPKDGIPVPQYVVEFDAESHTYYVDGEPVVSNTQVLKEAGFIDDSFFTEWSRQRGTYVHELCAIYDGVTGDSKWDAIFERQGKIETAHGRESSLEVGDYFQQYICWRKTREGESFVWAEDGIEELVFSPALRCAGRLDRRTVAGDILDLKTAQSGQPPNWVKYQTVGYAVLKHGMTGLCRRFSLTLSRESFKLDEYPVEEYLSDRDTFLCALHTVRAVRALR